MGWQLSVSGLLIGCLWAANGQQEVHIERLRMGHLKLAFLDIQLLMVPLLCCRSVVVSLLLFLLCFFCLVCLFLSCFSSCICMVMFG